MENNSYLAEHPAYRELEIAEFIGGSLKLIMPSPKYAPASLGWVSDKEVVKMLGEDFSNVSLEGEVERIRNILSDKDAYHWLIELTGMVVGNINLQRIEEMTREFGVKAAALSYLIGDKSLWGQGITTTVARAVIDWAFDTAGFRVIVARVVPQNLASGAVLKKLGFEQYGTEPYDGPDFGEATFWNTYRLTKKK